MCRFLMCWAGRIIQSFLPKRPPDGFPIRQGASQFRVVRDQQRRQISASPYQIGDIPDPPPDMGEALRFLFGEFTYRDGICLWT